MSSIQVAIDGPAGAGKSTISKLAAKDLGFVYVDTGAMYRSVALYAIRKGIDIKNNHQGVVDILDEVDVDICYNDNGTQAIMLNGEDVSDKIRTLEVSQGASDVAVIPEVRIKLVELQRQIASAHDVVMDGRDIGTYVLPDATVKIFLTATPEDRARRRMEEMLAKGEEVSFENVLRDVNYRDKNDSSREFAPLKQAEDAIVLDTTGNELEESIRLVIDTIRENI